jgi:hypothetical protein
MLDRLSAQRPIILRLVESALASVRHWSSRETPEITPATAFGRKAIPFDASIYRSLRLTSALPARLQNPAASEPSLIALIKTISKISHAPSVSGLAVLQHVKVDLSAR